MNRTLPEAFWINLARSAGRRKRFLERANSRKLVATRVEAVDGDDVASVRRAIRWSETTVREAACIASHLRAIRLARLRGLERALVLEDDTTFEPVDRFPDLWDAIDSALPARFGIVALTIAQAPRVLDRHFAKEAPVMRLARDGFWSTGAYVVDRTAMERLAEKFGEDEPFDVRSHRLRHDAYSLLMRSWSDDRTIDGPWVARVPLFSFEGDDSEIHPHHLDEHRVSRAFVHAHFADAWSSVHERRYGIRPTLRRGLAWLFPDRVARGPRARATR
ncbi:MAG: glycosyltransferase family 25 protein [Polyangiaceae bacterium]